MNNIAIIPARSGSKGLPDKNIRLLAGKPLLAYSVEAALASNLFDEVMVSTDSAHYAEVARECGAAVPFFRSEKTSSDTASSEDAVLEVLERYRDTGRRFDTICLLQPTSPLRTTEDIKGAYMLFEEKNAGAVTGVCEVDHPPQWMMVLPEDGSLDSFRKQDPGVPRQLLPTTYRLNGGIFINRILYPDGGKVSLLKSPEYAYCMDRRRSVDIDEEVDFLIAETLIRAEMEIKLDD